MFSWLSHFHRGKDITTCRTHVLVCSGICSGVPIFSNPSGSPVSSRFFGCTNLKMSKNSSSLFILAKTFEWFTTLPISPQKSHLAYFTQRAWKKMQWSNLHRSLGFLPKIMPKYPCIPVYTNLQPLWYVTLIWYIITWASVIALPLHCNSWSCY